MTIITHCYCYNKHLYFQAIDKYVMKKEGGQSRRLPFPPLDYSKIIVYKFFIQSGKIS